ncbi:hypothetical protein B296_00018852 [Ensete ventricosum]|uniref:Uncharacterized protein n=1 Tax=Ensete ventricosum TaxID=4639 RepID=A0A427A5J1_ENSVE|nr:hypothetical protein B296_00018852 [Ensete ventricosum]
MSVCTSSSTSVKVEVSNSGQLCVSKIDTSDPAIWFSLFLEPEPKVLHKGLVNVGTFDVTPPMSRSTSQAAKGKEPVDLAKETPTPRWKPKSVRELCSASAGVDGWDYHAIWMCNLPERAPNVPLEIDLTPLTHGTWIWLDGEASTRTQVQEMETKLLKLTRARDALRTDLPRQAIEDYKKSAGFEMGLVRMGRVSLEYRYQLALAQLRA